ncbi:hypothetical protein DOTSEDRAFT_54218 [Dothistroma septosporum NZE10]|uniref:Uncharacterized protein n=1 Tax=Dothistroma septosporum (strain NZE10 / CBS 128990) TaxID=675120 RepID=M2YN59_DOTSN|nr:hypothetical protein DOTSEDRAFT_54218 [Dothistroma septosporum NZE10]
MEYMRGAWNGLWGYVISRQPQVLQLQPVRSTTGQSEGSEADDEDIPGSLPWLNDPAGDDLHGTTAATTRSGSRRRLYTGSTTGGLRHSPMHNGSRQGFPISRQSTHVSRRSSPPQLTSPPHYYQRPEQALESHEQKMKRRLEERHDRQFVKRRKVAPFASAVSKRAGLTVEKEQWYRWLEKADLAEVDKDDREEPPVQPRQSSPKSAGIDGNVGGDSRVESQREARQELLDLSLNAPGNRRSSQSPTGSPSGRGKKGGRSTSRSAPGPSPPEPFPTGPPGQPRGSGAGSGANGRPFAPRTSPKPGPPKQSGPRTRSSQQPVQGDGYETPDDLKIFGTNKLCDVNNQQGVRRSLSPAGRTRRGKTSSGNSASPPLQTDRPGRGSTPPRTGPVASPNISRPKSKSPLWVDVLPETETIIRFCEASDWGTQYTGSGGLYCLLRAILQSIQAQHPYDDRGLTVEGLRDFIVENAVDTFNEYLLNLDEEQLRQEKNFNTDEAGMAVAALGYRLIVISERNVDVYTMDMGKSDRFEQNGGYLIVHHDFYSYRAGHFSSVGPYRESRDGGQIRVNTVQEPRGPTPDDALQTAVQDSLETAKKEAAARTTRSKAWSRKASLDNGVSNSNQAITDERLASFRDGLSAIIHQSRYTKGTSLNVVHSAVNYNLRCRPGNALYTHVEFEEDEVRAALTQLFANHDLVEYPVHGNYDRVRRHRDLSGPYFGANCPRGPQISREKQPPQARNGSASAGQTSGQPRSIHEHKHPKRTKSKSPEPSADPEVQIPARRLSNYRKGLVAIMDHAEHRPKYFNPGVKHDKMLLRLNRYLERIDIGNYREEGFIEAQSKAVLSALDAKGDLVRYPVGEDLLQRLGSPNTATQPQNDNTIQESQIETETLAPKQHSGKGKAKSPPPSSRHARNSSHQRENVETETLAPKQHSGKKRKSTTGTSAAPAVSPSKRRKSPETSTSGLTKSGKRRPAFGSLAKKLEDMANKK